MAGYFPSVNFDMLANLPNVIDDTLQRGRTRETLADLKSGDADSLIDKGSKLLAIGNTKEGLALIAEGRQRKAIEQRSEELRLYMGMIGGQKAVPPAAAPSASDAVTTFGGSAPTPPTVAPGADPFAAPPASLGTVIPGAQSSLPPLSGPAAAALPQQLAASDLDKRTPPTLPILNPMGLGPLQPNPPSGGGALKIQPGNQGERLPYPPGPLGQSPSDQMIAAAQGGGPAPSPAGPQLAGPLPTASGPAPLAPAVPGPELLRGAQAPAFTTQAPGGAPPAPKSPTGPGFPIDPGVAQEVAALQAELDKAVSNKFGAARVRGIQMQLKAAIDKGTWTKEDKSYMQDQTDRMAEGLPVQNRGVWEAAKGSQGEVIKDARKLYEETEITSSKAKEVAARLELMDKIARSPTFLSGETGKRLTYASGTLANLWDAAKAIGVDVEGLTGITKAQLPGMSSAALGQVFEALANQTVVTSLGTLGNQISNSDRDFISRAFPGLAGTKEGTQLLIQVMTEATKHAQMTANAARMYIKNNRGKEDTADLRDAMDKVSNSRSFIYNKDGTLNDLGKKIEQLSQAQPASEVINKVFGGGQPAAPKTTVPAGTTIYDSQGRPFRMTPDGPVPITGGGI